MGDTGENHDERMHRIAALLLEHREGKEVWGELSLLAGQQCTKRIANKFLICCLLDWQMESTVAWRNGYRLVESILGDPDDVWKAITSIPESSWASRHIEYKLHRYGAGHRRLWSIAWHIYDIYDGDVRRIWTDKEPSDVIRRLGAIVAGDQIPRMIVGALLDCGQIKGTGDVKADVHVCRVLGRAVNGDPADSETAGKLAQELNPMDPWQLDWPLWTLGKSHCHARTQDCARCYLAPHCSAALKRDLCISS